MQNLSLIRRVKAYGLQRRMSLKGRFLAFVALAAVLGLSSGAAGGAASDGAACARISCTEVGLAVTAWTRSAEAAGAAGFD